MADWTKGGITFQVFTRAEEVRLKRAGYVKVEPAIIVEETSSQVPADEPQSPEVVETDGTAKVEKKTTARGSSKSKELK